MFVFKADLKTYKENNGKYSCFDDFVVTDIKYQGRVISSVTIRNTKNGIVTTFGEGKPTRKPTNPTPSSVEPTYPTERPVTQAEVTAIKKACEKKGMNISLVLAMANVETLEGLTPDGYNRIVKVLREM